MSEKRTDLFHKILSEQQKKLVYSAILIQHFHIKDEEPRKGERQVDDQRPQRSRYS